MARERDEETNDLKESLDSFFGGSEEESPAREDRGFDDPGCEDPDLEDPGGYEDYLDPDGEPEASDFDSPPETSVAGDPESGSGMRIPVLLAGIVFTACGIYLGLSKGDSSFASFLTGWGFEPSSLLLGGLVLCGLVLAQRRSDPVARRIREDLEDLVARVDCRLEKSAEEVGRRLEETVPVDDQQLNLSLKKLENMIANLNKAMRMFNKPLLDVVTRLSDIEQKIEDVNQEIRAVEKAMAENLVTSEKKWEGMIEILRGHTDALEEQLHQSRDHLLDEIKPFIEEKANNAGIKIGQRLDEDRKEREADLEKRFESLKAALTEERPDAREVPVDLGPIEASLREVLDAVRGLEACASSPVPVREGGGGLPRTSPEPAATAGEAAQASKPSAEPATDPGRTVRVLSAIEKLKQMRGG